jgi:hypothetical protein
MHHGMAQPRKFAGQMDRESMPRIVVDEDFQLAARGQQRRWKNDNLDVWSTTSRASLKNVLDAMWRVS